MMAWVGIIDSRILPVFCLFDCLPLGRPRLVTAHLHQKSGRNSRCFVATRLALRTAIPRKGGFGSCSISLCTPSGKFLKLCF